MGSKVKMTFTVPGPNDFPHDDFSFRYEGIVVRLAHLTDCDFGLALRWENIEEGEKVSNHGQRFPDIPFRVQLFPFLHWNLSLLLDQFLTYLCYSLIVDSVTIQGAT